MVKFKGIASTRNMLDTFKTIYKYTIKLYFKYNVSDNTLLDSSFFYLEQLKYWVDFPLDNVREISILYFKEIRGLKKFWLKFVKFNKLNKFT